MSVETKTETSEVKDTTVSSLDALLSPQDTAFQRDDHAKSESEKEPVRASIAESDFNDIALDDEDLASVPLSSARQSAVSINEPDNSDATDGVDITEDADSSFNPDLDLTPLPGKSHKKTASTTTIRSSRGLSFLDHAAESKRLSAEGQQKFQEELARLQKEDKESHETTGAIDWDFWGAVISDYQGFAAEQPERLAKAIASGIPHALRGMMWQHMAASKDPELESAYLQLLKETSPHEKAITRDLGRTFPHHDFFTDGQGIGQENLFNVLKAYSLYDHQVGYCQGLPFVVAILLLNMPDEEAFSLLVRLMHVYDLRGHYLPEMPKLQLRLVRIRFSLLFKAADFVCFQVSEELLPVLHVHFLRQGIKSSMYCSQWFLTMFSYRFPLDVVFRIYDNCLASGIEAIFGFSITLLKKNEDILLKLKFDEILSFLNTRLFECYKIENSEDDANIPSNGKAKEARYRVDEFVQDAVNLRITPFMLDCYRHEYEDMIRENNKRAIEMDELRNSNRQLSAQVKALEASLAQLNTEHVEVLNELVKARLRNEEMEGELVRYKLLYAEAMHENQDAQSSHRISMLSFKRGTWRSFRRLQPRNPLRSQPNRTFRTLKSRTPHKHHEPGSGSAHQSNRWLVYSGSLLLLTGAGVLAYHNYQPFRHTTLAVVRCSRVARAAVLGAVDYKYTFARHYDTEDEKNLAYSECHTRSAKRVLRALLANGGIFIKLGQHMASLVVLPKEWTSTMRPLQDQCEPTAYEAVEDLFVKDMGKPLSEIFEEFDPNPIGVASLAQVHIGRLRDSGKRVAVKLQHPHLAEFCDIDMNMVEVTLGWIKYWFPEFEFTWLGEEMRTNLPKEMDFVHEASNAARAAKDFEDIKTSLYIPEVIVAKKRVLIMEFIQGRRVDDLEYLAAANIDRNTVSLELARIFNQMVFINGWFHADPHPGNLLIRPSPIGSRSPYNFEIVLLDHGLYFDIDPTLRVNYAKLWLSLIAPASAKTTADRKKYAELVGNIGPDLYPVFEAALTGRANLQGSVEEESESTSGERKWKRASSMMDMRPQSEAEMEAIRTAVVNREGLLLSVFDILRRVPRRVLMVLKLNDLTRSLDYALMTTHSNVRVFLVTAKYCAYAVWQDDRRRVIDSIKSKGLFSRSVLYDYFSSWWSYRKLITQMTIAEVLLDTQARLVQTRAWLRGLWLWGFDGARKAAAGLAQV
ncbi:hypothetical protein AX16_002064 [Volvariella volvacea WC 439]|nr:hypothetical protein AX16_002064 [Volvariella volvacea WC 439]